MIIQNAPAKITRTPKDVTTHASPNRHDCQQSVPTMNNGNAARIALSLLALLGASFLLLPMIGLLAHISPASVGSALTSGGLPALAVSLQTTAIAMTAIVIVGTPLGWLLARRRGPLWRTVEFLMFIPLLLPPLVIGLLLVYFYGPYGPLGEALSRFQLSASNNLLAITIAEIYESMPYYVFAAQAAFSQVDVRLERASLALGQPPVVTFRRVTLPLSAPGLSVGLAMAFARSLGAFGAVIVVAYDPHTLPVAIWIALEEQGLPGALPLAFILLMAALPLPLLTVLLRRRLTRGIFADADANEDADANADADGTHLP